MTVVGVVGAGAAGLCALRHILNTRGLTPVLWEKSKVIGGTWVYTEQLGHDEHGLPVHSSMYKSLTTNLPKEVMGFPGFPFKSGGRSFIHHTEVLAYLLQYAQHYDLEKHIKFEHAVEQVTPIDPGSPDTGWLVTTKDLNTSAVTTIKCDAFIVCNGHYTTPHVPVLPNIDSFSGTTLHSHLYRRPDAYVGQRVAVLGAAASGMDIALELATVADQVYLCHNFPLPLPSTLPANMRQVAGISHVKEGTTDVLVLRGGEEVIADHLLYCTGYQFTFPFLSPECGVTVEENQVKPLYQHLVHCNHPTMAFIGIPFQICPFPFFDVQIQYFTQSLSGGITLPTPTNMLKDTAQETEERLASGESPRHLHKMLSRQWSYMRRLEAAILHLGDQHEHTAAASNCIVAPQIKEIFNLCIYRRLLQLVDYKQYDYILINNGNPTFIESRGGKITKPRSDVIILILKVTPFLIWNNFAALITIIIKVLFNGMKKLIYQH